MLEKKLEIFSKALGDFYRGGQREFLFSCPFCKHHKKKLSVNFDVNAAKCWVCNKAFSDLFLLLKRLGNKTAIQEWAEVEGKLDFSSMQDLSCALSNHEEEEKKERIELPVEFRSLVRRTFTFQDERAMKYLLSRGITQHDVRMYKIGYVASGPYEGRILFPSFDEVGDLNYFVARSFVGHKRKYFNPPSSKDVIFNELYVDFHKPVVFVEGIFDAIKAGFQAVPILGSTLSVESRLFKKIFRSGTEVLFALDPDAIEKEIKLMNMLMEYGVSVRKVDIGNNKDVGEMTKEEFQRCCSKSREYTREDDLFVKLLETAI